MLVEQKVDGAGAIVVTFRNVPAGGYAVAAMHDADDNGTLTMRDGRMAQGTALSNAAALRSAPTFAVGKVTIPAAGATLSR